MRINSIINSMACYTGNISSQEPFSLNLYETEENSHQISGFDHHIENQNQPFLPIHRITNNTNGCQKMISIDANGNQIVVEDQSEDEIDVSKKILDVMNYQNASELHFKLLVQSIKLGSRFDAKKIIGRIRYHIPDRPIKTESFTFEKSDRQIVKFKEKIPAATKIEIEVFENENFSKPIEFKKLNREINIYLQIEEPKNQDKEIPTVNREILSISKVESEPNKPRRIITQIQQQEKETRAVKNRIKKDEEKPDHISITASSMETSLKVSASSSLNMATRPQDLTNHEVVESVSESSEDRREDSSSHQ